MRMLAALICLLGLWCSESDAQVSAFPAIGRFKSDAEGWKSLSPMQQFALTRDSKHAEPLFVNGKPPSAEKWRAYLSLPATHAALRSSPDLKKDFKVIALATFFDAIEMKQGINATAHGVLSTQISTVTDQIQSNVGAAVAAGCWNTTASQFASGVGIPALEKPMDNLWSALSKLPDATTPSLSPVNSIESLLAALMDIKDFISDYQGMTQEWSQAIVDMTNAVMNSVDDFVSANSFDSQPDVQQSLDNILNQTNASANQQWQQVDQKNAAASATLSHAGEAVADFEGQVDSIRPTTPADPAEITPFVKAHGGNLVRIQSTLYYQGEKVAVGYGTVPSSLAATYEQGYRSVNPGYRITFQQVPLNANP